MWTNLREQRLRLGPDDRRLYDQTTDRFEAQWRSSPEEPPELAAFLVADEPLRTVLLVGLVMVDMEQRRQRQRLPAETYFARFPELQVHPAAQCELVLWEAQLANVNGGTSEEYWRRFPHLAARLVTALPWPYPPGYTGLSPKDQGGMGDIWTAIQTEGSRPVVIKTMRSDVRDSEEAQRRFRREIHIMCSLAEKEHPHVVQFRGRGEHYGRIYFAMDYIDGGSLQTRPYDPSPMGLQEAARLVAIIAHAVQHLHSQGIVHRDIKPANVLLTQDATPKLSDFGLAQFIGEFPQPTHAEDSGPLTTPGTPLGTLAYMAPEQARCERPGVHFDIYALAAVLYKLLTNRPPFQGANDLDLLTKVCQEEVVPPRQLQPNVDKELNAICFRALAKEPGQRPYQTALELAQDLERALEGKTVKAKRYGAGERVWKWVKRSKALAFSMAVFVVAAVVATSFGVLANRRANDAEEALQAKARAQLDTLVTAVPLAIPDLLKTLRSEEHPIAEQLARRWAQERNPSHRARLAMALLTTHAPQAQAELTTWMLQAPDPEEAVLTRDLLVSAGVRRQDQLWGRLEDQSLKPHDQLRTLVLLTRFDPENQARWQHYGAEALRWLLAADQRHYRAWVPELRRVRAYLLPPLRELYGDPSAQNQRPRLTELLIDYGADAPALLAEQLLLADPSEFLLLRNALQNHPQKKLALARLRESLTAPTPPTVPGRQNGDQDVRHARQQAQAATALLLLTATDLEPAWALFRAIPSAEARAQVIQRVGLLGVDPRLLVDRLLTEQDLGARRALILALGEYRTNQLPQSLCDQVTARLKDWYRQDPDPGVHAAIAWLLRPSQEGPEPRLHAWNQQPALEEVDLGLRRQDPASGVGWQVNRQGMTLVVMSPAEPFRMGLDQPPAQGEAATTPHWRRIDRTFLIGAKPITVRQFKVFLQEHPYMLVHTVGRYCPDEECACVGVSWYMAAHYCNWLSAHEGIPKDQWCYEPNPQGKYDAGMRVKSNYLHLQGYRLPTEAEWEYACRAGTSAPGYFGSSREQLSRYAWHANNSEDRTWPPGQKRPNDLGLFDMLGNVWCWVQDPYMDYPQVRDNDVVQDMEDHTPLLDTTRRAMRGLAFRMHPKSFHACFRGADRPSQTLSSVGFRVARTWPTPPRP